MLPEDKIQNGLCALNRVLVLARMMAFEQASSLEIAKVLDVAEYLPRLLAAEEDQSAAFREQLVDLAQEMPSFESALHCFDNSELPIPW